MTDNLPLIEYKEKSNNPPLWKDFLPLSDMGRKKVNNPCSLVDKVLISKLNIGDYSAFSCIFSAYYKDLVMFASRFTHDYDNAEEIVQDTFVKLWEERKSVNVKISLKSFLLKSVQNKCFDWYRHKKIKQAHYDFIIKSSLHFDHDTENYILYSELQEELENAIEMLPGQISEAFRMNRYQGLKYHEIAGILNVSVRTVEVRIGKALSLLRTYLKEYLTIIAGLVSLLI